MTTYKIPISVLVVIHTPDLQVLLIERADRPGFWQSVTGSQDEGETLRETAAREAEEETGLDAKAGVLTDWEFPTIGQIWHAQESRGARVVHVPEAADGTIPVKPTASSHTSAMSG